MTDRTVRSSDPDFVPASKPDHDGVDCSAFDDLIDALDIVEEWLMDAPMFGYGDSAGMADEDRVIEADTLLRLVQRLNACKQHLEDRGDWVAVGQSNGWITTVERWRSWLPWRKAAGQHVVYHVLRETEAFRL